MKSVATSNAPRAIGPYSQAVITGNLVFCSGQIPLDPETMEIVGDCEPCGKMDAIQPGLKEKMDGRRGMLAMVINGGRIKVGDPVRVEP